jgi:hypothetical protein
MVANFLCRYVGPIHISHLSVVGWRRLGRLLCSYGFRFSVSTWNLFEIAFRDSDVYSLERTVPLTFNVHCACSFAHPTPPFLRHFSLYWVILLLRFGRIWVSMGVVIHPASYPMGTRDSFPGGKAAGAWSWPLTSISCRGQECVESCASTPQYVFMAWCLVKHRGLWRLSIFLFMWLMFHRVASYGLDTRDSFPGMSIDLRHHAHFDFRAHSTSYLIGTMVKRPEHEAD